MIRANLLSLLRGEAKVLVQLKKRRQNYLNWQVLACKWSCLQAATNGLNRGVKLSRRVGKAD